MRLVKADFISGRANYQPYDLRIHPQDCHKTSKCHYGSFMHNLQPAIDDYKTTYADEQNISDKTRKSRRLFMNRVSSYFTDKPFDLPHCRDFLNEIRKKNTPTSMRTYASALRAFIRFLVKYEYIEKDFSSLIKIPEAPNRIFNLITEAQAIEAILAGTEPRENDNRYAKKSKKECRMGLFFIAFTGLRNSELRKLNVEDFNLNEKIFTVHSKGGKIELGNVPINMVEPLKVWISVKKTGKMFEVNEETLVETLQRGCRKLSLPEQRVQDLRHIFSLTRLRRKEPLQLVSRSLRHKKIATTDKYYSQYLVTDLASTVNNSPEIQKQVDPETILDSLEQQLKNFGVTHDQRFHFKRENGRIVIESRSS